MTSIKTKHIVTIICSLLIFLFVYTALSKLLAFERFKGTLSHSPIPESMTTILKWGIPLAELLTAILLFSPKTQVAGLWLSFILMLLFTLYVAYMILFIPHLPCSCGGIISSLSWKQHLAVNLCFTLLAVTGIVLKKRNEIFIRINRTSRTPV